MVMTIEDIQTLVGLQLGRRNVSAQERLMEDLGAESADIVNIIATIEDKYQISLEEADISRVRTVRDLYDLIKST
ncbi:MAG: phosphopantetheine-binding protein [Candidatus Aminicenantes bacterium]|jgi:acyl carrier protein